MPANEGYSNFVKQAFIDPIRSVLIVDDDYPTFEEILSEQKDEKSKARPKDWRKNPAEIKRVLDSFRAPGRQFLIDIHDGSNVPSGEEEKAAAHLHQTDLLVLDYQLDGNGGDGTKAIKIVRTLMENRHFNLVIVHTNYALDDVFSEMLLGIMSPAVTDLKQSEKDDINRVIEELDQETEGASERIRQSFFTEQYFAARRDRSQAKKNALLGEAPFVGFKAVCDSLELHQGEIVRAFEWSFDQFEKRNREKMNRNHHEMTWLREEKWIRTNALFMAFTKKASGVDILDELLSTLVNWSPRPSRLILAKLRAEIEEYGVVAEDAALGDNYVLARWYKQLIDGDVSARRVLIDQSISRHSEQLFDFVRPRVAHFASELIEVDAKGKLVDRELIQYHFRVDLGDEAESRRANRSHNHFVCSKRPDGWHLETGHIFAFDSKFWICLSPLCDLVPGQKTGGYFKDVGGMMPFLAVKLRELSEGQVNELKDVQTNRYIFLMLNGESKVFCLNDPAQLNSAPHWYPLHAGRRGVLNEDMSFDVYKVAAEKDKLISEKHSAQIVGHLRYEYALNLLQSLGANFTRIGLGFVG